MLNGTLRDAYVEIEHSSTYLNFWVQVTTRVYRCFRDVMQLWLLVVALDEILLHIRVTCVEWSYLHTKVGGDEVEWSSSFIEAKKKAKMESGLKPLTFRSEPSPLHHSAFMPRTCSVHFLLMSWLFFPFSEPTDDVLLTPFCAISFYL